jgi:hypothetical protein
MFPLARNLTICALLFSIGSAQNCQTIFEDNTKDTSYWYGFSIKDLNRKSKIKQISEQVVSSSVKNLSFSIYSNVVADESQTIIDKFDGKKSKFSDKFVSNVSINTKVSGIEYEIVSQGRCDKQYYSLVRLNKSSFVSKQTKVFNSLISQSKNINESNFVNLFNYLSSLNRLFVELDNMLIGIIEPSYQGQIDSTKNNLKNKYFSAFQSIEPGYNYTLPYSNYDTRSNNLEITFNSTTTNLPVTSGHIFLKSLGKMKKLNFNSNGKILYYLDNNIRSQSTVSLDIALNLNDLLLNHDIVKNSNVENLKFNYIISEEPLVVHYEDNFLDNDLATYFFDNLKVVMSNSSNVNLSKNSNAVYVLRIEASDKEKKFNELTSQYIYILRDINFQIINNITNKQIFNVERDSLKGVSFQSFKKATKRFNKDLKIIGNELTDEFDIKILTL